MRFFVIVLDMHTRSPGSQSYHIVLQLQPHRYPHVRQEIGSTFSWLVVLGLAAL